MSRGAEVPVAEVPEAAGRRPWESFGGKGGGRGIDGRWVVYHRHHSSRARNAGRQYVMVQRRYVNLLMK